MGFWKEEGLKSVRNQSKQRIQCSKARRQRQAAHWETGEGNYAQDCLEDEPRKASDHVARCFPTGDKGSAYLVMVLSQFTPSDWRTLECG